MKTKKLRIAGYVFAGTLISFSAFSVFASTLLAPSQMELAEMLYSEAATQRDYWVTKEKERKCTLIDVKLSNHAALNLAGTEIERLATLKRECEGK